MRAWPALLVAGALLALPGTAFAGRLIVTGHDADRRCAQLAQQCGFLKAALRYVRESAPSASKPILVLDRGPRQLAAAIRKAWARAGYAALVARADAGATARADAGATARADAGLARLADARASASPPRLTVVDPRSGAFARLRIDTKRFSAIAIASDSSCGGCDLEAADAAAIYKRRKAIQAFLNRGGGIYAGAGGSNATAYYAFMPIPAPGPPSGGPFELTAYGREIGFRPADIAEAVANTFAPPEVGRMDVAARSAGSSGQGDTLIADGRVRGGKLVAGTTIPPALGRSIVVQPVAGVVLGHPPDDPTFRRIAGAANLVSGWTFDVTKGRVSLTTAANSRGATQTTQAYEGFFTALQTAGSAVTDLVLRSGNFDAVCGSGGVDVARASASTKPVRHLWASGKGKFRTKGRFASAVIRGTEWLTEDRCDGTLVTVKAGAVAVFDQVLQKTVVVRAGKSYLARAP